MKPNTEAQNVVAYLRVSTAEQVDSGLGLEAQAASIAAEADRRGWSIVETFADAGVSGSIAPLNRPGMAEAVGYCSTGGAGVIVVAKLDRLSRDTKHALEFNEQANRRGFRWFAVDADDDTTTADGEFMFTMRMGLATRERKLIGERTRAALAAKKAQGHRLGRPIALPEDVRQRIATERRLGSTYRAIAARLTAEGVPTARGGSWHAATISEVCKSVELDAEMAYLVDTNVLVN